MSWSAQAPERAAMPAGTGTASVTPERGLRIDAASGYELSFSNDSSGALAALGADKSRAVYVGDSEVDAATAQAAN